MDDYQKRLDTIKAILKANLEKKKQEQQKNKVVKTSNVDTAPTPLEKANALKKKESSKYTSYIASKLLPGLDK